MLLGGGCSTWSSYVECVMGGILDDWMGLVLSYAPLSYDIEVVG
jgi:hypothetical protein